MDVIAIGTLAGSLLANIVLAYGATVQSKKTTKIAEDAVTNKGNDLVEAQKALIEAKDAALLIEKKTAADWKAQSERIEDVYEKSRENWHKKAEQSNAIMLKLTEENSILKAQTDLKPVIAALEHISKNQDMSTKILVKLAEQLKVDVTHE